MKKLYYIIVCLIVWNCTKGQNWLGFGNLIPVTGYVQSLYTNPTGTKLYIGGIFNATYNGKTMKNIMVYDGVTFDSLGTGVTLGLRVQDIIEYKNNIYAAGRIGVFGNTQCNGVAKWNGIKWDSLMPQLEPSGYINAFKIYNNELYMGGRFSSIGTQSINTIAKYDGTNWSQIGSGFPFTYSTNITTINCIEVYNNEVYAGGNNIYDSLGNHICIAKFDGSNWKTVGVIMYGGASEITDLKVYNNHLYAVGRFKQSEGNVGNSIMRYDGTSWSNIGKAITDVGNCIISKMQIINNKLWVVGVFKSIEDTLVTDGIASWNDTVWCVPPTGTQNYQSCAVAEFQNKIFMGGAFYDIGNDTVPGLAVLNTDSTSCTINLTNIKTHTKEEDFITSPNPFTDNITIQIPSKYNLTDTKFTITNNLGQVLLNYNPSSYKQILNLSNLSSGVYYLTIQDSSINKTVKLIKQ